MAMGSSRWNLRRTGHGADGSGSHSFQLRDGERRIMSYLNLYSIRGRTPQVKRQIGNRKGLDSVADESIQMQHVYTWRRTDIDESS